jgi:hypothetical protein
MILRIEQQPIHVLFVDARERQHLEALALDDPPRPLARVEADHVSAVGEGVRQRNPGVVVPRERPHGKQAAERVSHRSSAKDR